MKAMTMFVLFALLFGGVVGWAKHYESDPPLICYTLVEGEQTAPFGNRGRQMRVVVEQFPMITMDDGTTHQACSVTPRFHSIDGWWARSYGPCKLPMTMCQKVQEGR